MPSNSVVINGSDGFHWEVPDSKVDDLMKYLHTIGEQQQPRGVVVLLATEHFRVEMTGDCIYFTDWRTEAKGEHEGRVTHLTRSQATEIGAALTDAGKR